jgi:hypothetical protein
LCDDFLRVCFGRACVANATIRAGRRRYTPTAGGLAGIAGRMFLAEKTVKNYVSSLLAKLGLERRTQAAVLPTRLLGDHPR